MYDIQTAESDNNSIHWMSILKSLQFNLQNSCAIKSKIQQAVNIKMVLL